MSKILNDSVLLKFKKEERKERVSEGGIVLPGGAERNLQQVEAEVIDIGDGRMLTDGSRVKLTVKVGDTILVNPFVGVEVTINNEKYKLIKENDILVIF